MRQTVRERHPGQVDARNKAILADHIKNHYPNRNKGSKGPIATRGPEVHLQIKDLDGNVRFEKKAFAGTERNGVQNKKRELLKQILGEARGRPELQDWSNLDLTDLPFDGEDVSGFNFSGSDISRGSWIGAIVSGANFSGCKAHSTIMSGLRSTSQTWFCDMDAKGTNLDNSQLDSPNWRGSRMHSISAEQASWSHPVLTHTRQHGNDYTNATLTNGDWGRAKVVKSILKGAKLTDDLRDETNFALEVKGYDALESKDYPNKMRGALFVGCTTDKQTDMSSMIRGRLRRDKIMNKIASSSSSLAVTTLMAAPTIALDAAGLASFSEGMATMSLLYFTGVVDFLKDNVLTPAADKLKKLVLDSVAVTREEGQGSFKSTMHNLGVLFGRRGQLSHIVRGLEAVNQKRSENDAKSLFDFIRGDDHDVVVCDKRHLAEAIAHISSNRKRGYEVPKTITLVRQFPERRCNGIPSTVTFNKDGSTTMSWIENDETTMVAQFNEHGECVDRMDLRDGSDPAPEAFPHVGTLMETIDSFERAVLDEGGLTKNLFDYDSANNYVTAGQNGSIFVHRKEDRALHNEQGPAIVHMKQSGRDASWHTAHFFKEGVLHHPDEFEVAARAEQKSNESGMLAKSMRIFQAFQARQRAVDLDGALSWDY